MSRRQRLPLPESERRAILRAADDMIAEGGRTLLAKILKGSKEKKLLELELDRNPAYGFFRDLALEEIMDKIDRLIDEGYLDIELQDKLPLIVFTPYGWAIEKEQRAEEFLREWDEWIDNGVLPINMEYLKDRNRALMLLFLFKILRTGDKKYVPFLIRWERCDYKRVQAEIRNVVEALERREQMQDAEWERLIRERAVTLLPRPKRPLILACRQCDGPFVFDEENPEHYMRDGLRFPEHCPHCRVDAP